MSQKKTNVLYRYMLFAEIVISKVSFKQVYSSPKVFSLEKALKVKFGNTSRFFKKLAFIGLALSCVNFNKFHVDKMRSVMLVLWNTIASYTFIF